MKIWVDAQLSPTIAQWLTAEFGAEASPLREIGLRDAEDVDIFSKAAIVNAVILTRDKDFSILVQRLGPPPRVTCGNTSNAALMVILSNAFRDAIALLEAGETLIEIG